MTKNILIGSMALALAAMYVTPAFAHGNNACKPVWEACTAKTGKGKEAMSCVKTIKGGGTVEGVTVSDADAKACAAAPEHHHKKDAAPATDSSGASTN